MCVCVCKSVSFYDLMAVIRHFMSFPSIACVIFPFKITLLRAVKRIMKKEKKALGREKEREREK